VFTVPPLPLFWPEVLAVLVQGKIERGPRPRAVWLAASAAVHSAGRCHLAGQA